MSVSGQNGPTEIGDARALRWTNGGSVVLVPLRDGDVSQQAIELARTIASGSGSALVVLNAVCLPEQTPLDIHDRSIGTHFETVSRVVETVRGDSSGIPTMGAVHIGRNRLRILSSAVEKYGIEMIVVDDTWNDGLLTPLVRTPVEKLSEAVDPLVVLPFEEQPTETVSSILVPVSGGPHSGPAIEVAKNLASAHEAHIELLHVTSPTESPGNDTGNDILEARASRLHGVADYDTWLLEADRVEDAIIEQSQYYPVTIIGGPQTPRLRRFVFGSKSNTVREAESNSVITVWG